MNGFSPSSSRRGATAFSLIEVTLALGIVTFALVGVIGVLPVAMSSSRQSVDKNRAAATADTVFTSLRSQPFQQACYLTTDFDYTGTQNSSPADPLDLNALDSTTTKVFYATFLDVSALSSTAGTIRDDFGSQRRLCFTSIRPANPCYLVTMRFNNRPDGLVITPNPTRTASNQPTIPAQANQVELIISSISRPADQYHFVSIIANRTN